MEKSIIFIFIFLSFCSPCPGDKLCRGCLNGQCHMCQNSYLFDGICYEFQNQDIDPNCDAWIFNKDRNEAFCPSCKFGYGNDFRQGNNLCHKCEAKNCAACVDGQCSLCYDGLIPSYDPNGNVHCIPSTLEIPNCNIIYMHSNSCFKCDDNYSLNRYFRCEYTGDYGCLVVGNGDTCHVCKHGYYVNNDFKCSKSSIQMLFLFVILFIIIVMIGSFAAFKILRKTQNESATKKNAIYT